MLIQADVEQVTINGKASGPDVVNRTINEKAE